MPGRGQYSDHGWAGIMCLLGIQYAVIAISVIISCAVPLSFRAYIRATPEQIEDMSPSYGWWLPSKGNLSVFSPEVVNRTDWNVSSPTYGMWTPPPEWREHCIRTGGMPESLCSYFQYDEFPVFMTMFYTVTLAIVLAQMLRVVHHVWFVSRPKHNYINIAKAQAEGPSDYLTPWGCFANRGCLQSRVIEYKWNIDDMMMFTPWAVAPIMFSWFGPGMGLIHSMPSGKLYYGAAWNQHHLSDAAGVGNGDSPLWFFGIALYYPQFFGLVNAINDFSKYTNLYYSLTIFGTSPMAQEWTGTIVMCTFVSILKLAYLVSVSAPKDETYGAKGQRLFFNTVNGPGLKGIITSFKNSSHLGWSPTMMILILIIFTFPVQILLLSCGSTTYQGELGTMSYLMQSGAANAYFVACIVANLAWIKLVIAPFLYKVLAKGKKLLSAAVYDSRIEQFKRQERTIALTLGVFVLLQTLLLPHCLAINTFGLRDSRTYWFSPANLIFTQHGSANMLAAPIYRMVSMVWLAIAYQFKFAAESIQITKKLAATGGKSAF